MFAYTIDSHLTVCAGTNATTTITSHLLLTLRYFPLFPVSVSFSLYRCILLDTANLRLPSFVWRVLLQNQTSASSMVVRVRFLLDLGV